MTLPICKIKLKRKDIYIQRNSIFLKRYINDLFHITTNKLVMIEPYHKNHIPVSKIAKN